MQSSLKKYLLHGNKSSEGLLACNMEQTCQNNMLALQELSQTLVFKQKRTKISLKHVSAKINARIRQNELLQDRKMIQNDFLPPKNHELSKLSSKKSIYQAKSPRFYQQQPHSMQYSTPFTQFLRDVSHKQAQSPQLASHYPNHNSQCKQNKCQLFRNVFDSSQNHSTSKQQQASRGSQKLITMMNEPLTYDLCKSQSLSFQSKQIISQHPELSKDLQISFAISLQQQSCPENKQLLQTNDREGHTSRGKIKFLETKRSFVSQCSSYSSCQESIVVGKQEPEWIQFRNQLWNL